IARHVAALHRLAELTAAASSTRHNLFVDTDAVRRTSRQIQLEQSFGQVDLDGWEARLVDLTRDRGFSRTRKGVGYKFSKDATRADVLAAHDALLGDLQQFRKDADADLAACLQQELAGATARYHALKEAAGALDFTGLLSRARDLIRTDDSVRHYLQEKFTRIFVDEFQDTDPVQAEILLLLANDVPGRLFIVGDPKQAIYRFRGTDIGTYWRVRDRIAKRGGRVLQLTTSYRSVPAIQQFVNAAFAHEMTGEDVTRPYVDAIEARGVSHLLVGGKAFHGREEVETVRAALAAIEWPDDELSVFATLKGSLFAIDDEHLVEFRHRFGAFHPFRI